LDGTVANIDLAAGVGGIYKGSGSLSGATTVTQGTNTLAFNSTATNGFSVDGSTFSVDAANNRVGIGTTSPSTLFHTYTTTDGNDVMIEGYGSSTTTARPRLFIGHNNAGGGGGNIPDAIRLAHNSWGGSLSGGVNIGYGGVQGSSIGATSSFMTFGTTNNSNVPSERMRITNAGNVGIGTTSPTFPLDVRGGASFTSSVAGANALEIRDGGIAGTNPRLFTNAGTIELQTNDATATNRLVSFANSATRRMVILNNGNMGIGTETPNALLQFASTIANRKLVLYEEGNNDHQFMGFGINGGVLRYQAANSTVDHVFYVGTGTSSSNELFRIRGTGNVGIGTSQPVQKLDVNGGSWFGVQRSGLDALESLDPNIVHIVSPNKMTTNAVATPETALRLIKAGTNNVVYNQSADFRIGSYSSAFGTQATTRLTIALGNGATNKPNIDVMSLLGNGNVGIGTSSPITKLDLSGIKTTGAGWGTGSGNDGPSQAIIPAGFNGSSRSNDWPSGWVGGLSTCDIVGSATYFSTYVTRSDRKLKENILDMNREVVDQVMKLRPVTYTLKERMPETEGLQYGFIAQEVRELFPSIVTKAKDEEKGTIGMNYQALIAPLVKVVQSQQFEIENLKQINNTHQQKNEELIKRLELLEAKLK
jgi:hypothetical protein